jgi:class 3 adenylate cyclase
VVEAPRTRYAKSGDVHVAYHVLGDGPLDLLVLAGHFISIDSIEEEPSIARFHRRLASFSRLVRFDFRGVGLSDPLSPSSPPTIEQWVDDALAVMDAAGVARAAVFTSFSRVKVAIMLAAMHPDRVSSLVVVNGAARWRWAPDYPVGRSPEEEKTVWTVFDPDAVERGIDVLALAAPSVADNEAFRAWWDRAGNRGASPAMARAIGRISDEQDVRPLLGSILAPTLVLHRRDDRAVPVGHGRYLAEHIPDVKYVELEGADDPYWVGDTEAMLDEIEEFLTGGRQAPEGDVVTATILFTDIVASTEQSARLGHRKWTALTDTHDTMVRTVLARYRGREVKTIGDGFLATFDATTRAVRAATEIVTQAKAMGLEVRAGVHAGEVEVRPDDVVGLAVSIAKRICDLAGPTEVFISEVVKGHLFGSGIVLSEHGTHALKGVPDEWRLFSVES